MTLLLDGSVTSGSTQFLKVPQGSTSPLCLTALQTPEWLDSDSCQKCEQPFFWNFKQMWDSKKIGLRQVKPPLL